jgi:hypothetical protein
MSNHESVLQYEIEEAEFFSCDPYEPAYLEDEKEDDGGDWWFNDEFFLEIVSDKEWEKWERSQESQDQTEMSDEEELFQFEVAPLRHHRKNR